jgi:hypothetical protein
MRLVDLGSRALAALIPRRLLCKTCRLDQELLMVVGAVIDKPVATCLVLIQDSRDHLDHRHRPIYRLLGQLVIARNPAQPSHLLYPSIPTVCASLDRMPKPRVLSPPQRLQSMLCLKVSTHPVCAAFRTPHPSLELLSHHSKPGMCDKNHRS